jgi:copper(I)-binding protein
MRKHFGFTLAVSLLLAAPAVAVAAAPKDAATATVAVSQPAAPKATEQPTADTLTLGDLTVSHPSIAYKDNHIDVYLTIKNSSKGDEHIGGADTTLKSSGIVQVTKDKDGKEQEAPISETLPAEKSVEFTKTGTWLRIKDVQAEPKSTDVVPLTLFFRRSPNAVMKIPADAGKSAGQSPSVMDWLKK